MQEKSLFNVIYGKAEKELKNFGTMPIKDVGVILSVVQSEQVSENKVMELTQKIYIKLCLDRGKNLNQARQSWVVASGNNFEEFIRNLINNALNIEGILAVKGDQLKRNQKVKDIVQFLTLKANRRCTQQTTGVWPDSDIRPTD